MKYRVDSWNNFCRVFELPESYPEDYCFGGRFPINFQLVDWFNPVSDVQQIGVSKETWLEEVEEIVVKEITTSELFDSLVPFLEKKNYIKSGRKYLVLCDFGASFIFGL